MCIDLTYWRSTLQGKSLPIHENDPQEGWYRTRPRKGYRSLPVRIWRDEGSGEFLALRDVRRVDPYEVWTWVCMNPVSVEAYEAVIEKGAAWPDEIGLGRDLCRGRAIGRRSVERRGERRSRGSDGARPVTLTAPALGNTATMAVAVRGKVDSQRPTTTMAVGSHLAATMAVNPTMAVDQGLGTARMASADVNARVSSTSSQNLIGHNSSRSFQKSDPTILAVLDDQQAGEPAEALADEIALLWNEVSAWLEQTGIIADQVTADRCANFADAFACFEKRAEERRTTLKKPVLDQGRAIDQRWKPIVSAAEDAKRQCKKALEPFLIAETERLERELMEQLLAENGDLSILGCSPLSVKAGTFGRTISLRRVRKIIVSDRRALITRYHQDPRFLGDEAVQKLLVKLAEHDLQAGQSVPGVAMTEEKVAA